MRQEFRGRGEIKHEKNNCRSCCLMGRWLLDNRCLAFPFLVTSDINQKMEKQWHSYRKLGKGTIQMLEFLLITGHKGPI